MFLKHDRVYRVLVFMQGENLILYLIEYQLDIRDFTLNSYNKNTQYLYYWSNQPLRAILIRILNTHIELFQKDHKP